MQSLENDDSVAMLTVRNLPDDVNRARQFTLSPLIQHMPDSDSLPQDQAATRFPSGRSVATGLAPLRMKPNGAPSGNTCLPK